MHPDKARRIREAKIRSVGLSLSGQGMTDDDYQSMVEASHWRGCPYCGDLFNVSLGFDGPPSLKGSRYCTPKCASDQEQAQTVLIKSQPEVVSLDGFDV